MAFQVTQCPRCESTFNTDPRLLDLAEGKVRCGACLAVFQAEENFLLDDAELSSGQDSESVFVGSDPEDFFDPAVFLTRSSLQESTEIYTPTTQPPHIPNEGSSSQAQPKSDALYKEQVNNEQIENNASSESSLQADEADDSHLEFFAAVNESLEHVHEFDGIEDLQTIAELNALDNPNADMFTSDSNPDLSEKTSPRQQATDIEAIDEEVSEEDIEAVLAGELDDEEQHSSTTETSPESIDETEDSEPVDLDAIRKETQPKPEDVTLSISFAVEPQRDQHKEPQREEYKEPQQQEEDNEHQQVAKPEETSEEGLSNSVYSPESAESPTERPPGGNSLNSNADTEDSGKTSESEEEKSDPDVAAFNEAIEEQEFNASLEENSAPQATENSLDMELEDTDPSESHEEREPDSIEDLSVEGIESTDVDTSTEAIRARALQTQYQDEEALESIPEAHLKALDTMTPPVELSGGKPKTWRRQIALGILCVLLSGVLAGQYAWREIDRYAQEPLARQIFQRICSELACELPPYTNIDAIVSSNLTVRSHPVREDGLVVAVEIRNTGQFPQAFPVLVLSFNTSGNEVIALREFYPAEYLDPGLETIEMMPVLAPVQISLEIIDPGGDAMNYTMAFRLP